MATSSTERVRGRVRAEHAILRSLSNALVAVAREATCDGKQLPYVQSILGQLASELELHLEFEERELIPILREADAWGPVRVEAISEEHSQQRTLIRALVENARGPCDIGALAEELGRFVESFARDMAEEEEHLLNADALGEESVVLEQTDG